MTKNIIVCLTLLSLPLQPISLFADETKNISDKIGNQLSSKVRGEAINVISDSFEELNCQDAISWECSQTQQINTVTTVVFVILGVLGLLGLLGVLYRLLS